MKKSTLILITASAICFTGCSTLDTFVNDWVAPTANAYVKQKYNNPSADLPPTSHGNSATTDNPGDPYSTDNRPSETSRSNSTNRTTELEKCDWEYQPGDPCKP